MKNSKNLEPIGMEKPRWIFQGTWNRIEYYFAMISFTLLWICLFLLEEKNEIVSALTILFTKISLSIGV